MVRALLTLPMNASAPKSGGRGDCNPFKGVLREPLEAMLAVSETCDGIAIENDGFLTGVGPSSDPITVVLVIPMFETRTVISFVSSPAVGISLEI